LASGLGILLVLAGSFLVVAGFQTISECSNQFSYMNCWDPFQQRVNFRSGFLGGNGFFASILGFYLGSVMVALGAVTLLGGTIAGILGKLRGPQNKQR